MTTRREFVQTGLSAFFIGLMRRQGMGSMLPPLSASFLQSAINASRPILKIPNHPTSVMVQGMPFAPGWFGDPFPQPQIPFHIEENGFPNDIPPTPTEEVDVAIIGGGLSGLSTAYFLRHRYPVIFELHDRFGGVSKGEEWNNTRYSQGGAYFITPDKGSFLEEFYNELGLDDAYRLSEGGSDPVELNNVIHNDFWSGAGLPPDQILAFQKYAQIVQYFGKNYPEIPLPEGKDNQWILDLDQISLKQDIEQRMGMPIPPLLAAGIQGYCYSSFTAGWEEISAASGWNFIAAEEFGRWVCPGGNAYVTDLLWKKLVHAYKQGPHNHLDRIRPNTRAVDVRLAPDNKVLVSYKTPQGQFRSLLARKVVMANSKHICKYMLHDAVNLDPPKYNAMQQLITYPYVVANVLLEAPIPADFYDVFLLADGNFPTNEAEVEAHSTVTDMLNGSFTPPHPASKSVLTLYWPLPWGHAVFSLIDSDPAWADFTSRLVPQIDRMLQILHIPRSKVRQVRMTRWGHAMPVAVPGFIASGLAENIRRPFHDRVYFVNQDNWALPAFETCILEARHYATQIDS